MNCSVRMEKTIPFYDLLLCQPAYVGEGEYGVLFDPQSRVQRHHELLVEAGQPRITCWIHNQ